MEVYNDSQCPTNKLTPDIYYIFLLLSAKPSEHKEQTEHEEQTSECILNCASTLYEWSSGGDRLFALVYNVLLRLAVSPEKWSDVTPMELFLSSLWLSLKALEDGSVPMELFQRVLTYREVSPDVKLAMSIWTLRACSLERRLLCHLDYILYLTEPEIL